ncbi:hypothetical protein [Streptomyces sp. bgisy153]|uniref:hypothetical protein n=1 Tax=Streptomyces sp. bgisy153 TaxID=3413793 RepID=UPI003D74409E
MAEQARRRFRSGTVVLGGVGLLATALTACSSAPDKRCVDRNSYQVGRGYKVTSDRNCKTGTGSWYYGGKKDDGWVWGGSFTKPGKGSGSSSSGGSGVDRDGFGGGSGSYGG